MTERKRAPEDVGAEQERIAGELPPGIVVGSRTEAGHEQPRETTVVARGPHDNPEEGIREGDAMMVASHAPAPLGEAPEAAPSGRVLSSEAERVAAPARAGRRK